MASEQNLSAVIRQERGWPGHFVCADQCLFHRNTLLTCGDVRIVVSTVGRWMNREGQYETIGPCRYFETPRDIADRHAATRYETIGPCRYFETMAFHARYIDRYWDADVSREVRFSSPWCVSKLDGDDIANDQHDAVVDEIAGWMEAASQQVFIEEVCNAKNA